MVVSNRCRGVFVCIAIACVVAIPATAAPRVADLSVGAASLDWAPLGDYQSMKLTVAGAGGVVFEQTFAGGQAPTFSIFDKAGQRLADGIYNWELSAAPRVSGAVKRQLNAARRSGDTAAIERLKAQGLLPEGGVMAGTFAIANGSFVADEGQREGTTRVLDKARITAADQVIPDDLIVQGSACVGLDCVNNENFGFDTIRLKENNLRIHFDDTSTQAGFPANDWTLIANDSASGGSSKFSIEDRTSAKVPFTVTAGAATNSIFVDSTGRVGFRTSTPVLDLHVATSNTPALRLEQNNSGGFTAQTWDIGANEANFFVRDVTGGSRLSLRIRPGAPTSSLDISSDGFVGVGTGSPDSKLHVASTESANDGKLFIENTNGTATARELFDTENNGQVLWIMNDASAAGRRWAFATQGSNWVIDNQANAGTELTLSNTGNLTITGVYSPSDRNVKRDIVETQGADILARLSSMPVSFWSYKTDEYRHMGPMAQDFAKAFGLGINDTTINPMDLAGVSLAAAKALQNELQAKDAEISTLKQRLEALEAAVAAMANQR
jgi:hypothetical protein